MATVTKQKLKTDKNVRDFIAETKKVGKPDTMTDATIPGLTLFVSKTGAASWLLRYYAGTARKTITIGQYSVWGLSDARERARELRRNVDVGLDVAIKKQQDKLAASTAWTVDDLADAYFAKAENELVPHTFKQRKSVHARFVSPQIGKFPAASIESTHIVPVIKKSLSAGKTIPRVVLLHITQIFHHAVGNAICKSNPCRDIKESAVTGKPEAPKVRIALESNELGVFIPALATIPRQYDLAIRLMLLTGVRVGQITEAHASEFDLIAGTWAVPHVRRKNRRHTVGPFVIPLPTLAVEWVKELLKIADGNEYIFPVEFRRHSDARNSMSKRTTIGDWLDKMNKASGEAWRRITPHDTRSTCKTGLSNLGVPSEMRDAYLDHSKAGMDAIYDRADHKKERREIAEKWLAFLNDCESGKEAAKVVQLRTAAA